MYIHPASHFDRIAARDILSRVLYFSLHFFFTSNLVRNNTPARLLPNLLRPNWGQYHNILLANKRRPLPSNFQRHPVLESMSMPNGLHERAEHSGEFWEGVPWANRPEQRDRLGGSTQ